MLSGVFFGCQAAAKVMLARGRGSIINTASVNGYVAQPGSAAYCAAKAGVLRLTEVLGTEWAGRGVRVNALAPGVIATELVAGSVSSGAASMEAYERRSPMRRLGRVDELTNTFLYLASDRSSYVTGQTLRIDGGWASDHFHVTRRCPAGGAPATFAGRRSWVHGGGRRRFSFPRRCIVSWWFSGLSR